MKAPIEFKFEGYVHKRPFSPAKRSGSEWPYSIKPDPLILTGTFSSNTSQNVKIMTLDTLRFTILISEDGLSSQYTANWNITSVGYTYDDPGRMDIFIEIRDSHGNALDRWDLGPQAIQCGGPYAKFYNNPNGKMNLGSPFMEIHPVIGFGGAYGHVC